MRAKFQKLQTELVDVNMTSVVDELFSEEVISADDMRDLHHCVDQKMKSQRLMALLHTSRHPQAFVQLRQALGKEKAYSWILEKLDRYNHSKSNKPICFLFCCLQRLVSKITVTLFNAGYKFEPMRKKLKAASCTILQVY